MFSGPRSIPANHTRESYPESYPRITPPNHTSSQTFPSGHGLNGNSHIYIYTYIYIYSDVYTKVLKQEMSQEHDGVCSTYVHFKSSWFKKIIWILGFETRFSSLRRYSSTFRSWRDVGLFKGPWQKQTCHKGCLARCLQGLWPVHFIPTSQDVYRKNGLVRKTLQNEVTI